MRYDDLSRRVIAHHRGRGEIVDFYMMRHGAIVGGYRIRPIEETAWTDLLPTGASPEQYQATIQRLVPILFPSERVSIKAIVRDGDEVTITVERSG